MAQSNPQQHGHPWPQQPAPTDPPALYTGPSPYPPAPPPHPKRRSRGPGVWIGITVAAVVVLAGGSVLGLAATGKGPAAAVFKDSGITACEQIRDSAAAAKASPSTAPTAAPSNPADAFKNYQRFRAEFAGSRYDDLRTAGTQAIDLIYQMSTSGKDNTGMALVAAGELVKAWSALSGACAAHGVQVPKLGDAGS